MCKLWYEGVIFHAPVNNEMFWHDPGRMRQLGNFARLLPTLLGILDWKPGQKWLAEDRMGLKWVSRTSIQASFSFLFPLLPKLVLKSVLFFCTRDTQWTGQMFLDVYECKLITAFTLQLGTQMHRGCRGRGWKWLVIVLGSRKVRGPLQLPLHPCCENLQAFVPWFAQPMALVRFLGGRTECGRQQKCQLGSCKTGTLG